MGKRTFDVEAEPFLPEGFMPDGPPIDFPDRTALDQFMLDMSAVLDRIGGAFSVVTLRREIAPEMFVTVGFRAQWSSYAPAQRLPREEPSKAERHAEYMEEVTRPDPEPEPEDFGPDPEAQQDADAEEDFGPDAEEALREQAVAAAAG